jgi:HK97 family phage prohead protease
MDPEEEGRAAAAAAAASTRRAVNLAVQRRASAPSSYDAEARTVDLTAATGTPVLRYSWARDGYYWEVLEMSAAAADLGRVERGLCPLLDAHSRWSIKDQLGTVTGARFEAGELVLPVKFGETDAARQAEAQVAAEIVKGVSVGYRILELTLTSHKDGDHPVYTATRWELLEVSLCPVPADPAAGVRSEDGLHPCVIIQPKETRSMDPEEEARAAEAAALAARQRATPTPAPVAAPVVVAPAAPDASAARMTATDALTFAADARAFGIGDDQVRTWVDTLTPDLARAALLKAAADKQRAEAPNPPAGEAIRITLDVRDKMRTAAAGALLHRANPDKHKLEDGAREWRGMTLLEMARYNLEANGEKVRGLSKREMAELALRSHSTSDFPFILSNVANKTLRDGYMSSPQTFKAWQRRATAADFKQISRLQLGGAPSFLLVPEGGQFKMGTIGEGREVYALATFGRIFSITRQTLINDDLDAFSRIPTMMGRAAADLESDTAYAPLIANPLMGDGVALFNAAHGNLAAAGGAIAEAAVQARETAMGIQTGLEGRFINVTPKFLIVATKDKVAGQKLLSAVQATQTSGVNVYQNAMDLVVEARLSRTAGATPWFLAADPNQVDTIEYAYLDGEEGVYLEERIGFEVDGMEFKARLDIASKAIDHRGLQMDPGV